MLSGRGLCDELITRPEESSRLCCAVVCDLETSRMGVPYIYIYIYIYIYDISRLRVEYWTVCHSHGKNKHDKIFIRDKGAADENHLLCLLIFFV